MKTVIKNILDILLSEENKKRIIYTETGIKWTDYRSDRSYLDLVTTSGFANMLANYLWDNATRYKRKPKVIWPEGMLNYEKF